MIFATTAPAYYAKGVPVIPLYSKAKRPIPEDWSRYHDMPVEPETQQEWIQRCGNGNIGVVLGKQSRLCVLDIDSDDPFVMKLIQGLVPDSPWHRRGAKGIVMAFRWNGIRTFRIKSAKGESICELLSDRTQVVLPPSIHPDTLEPYQANCELLQVIDHLPQLDPQIEAILRGAFSENGIELSVSGSSRVTDFVSSGARDVSLTEKAGLFAYAVIRGERTLKEAIGMLRSYNTEFVEKLAGDVVDVEKHVTNLIKFLHRDVLEKNKQLPEGWDADMTDQEKAELGLTFEEEHEEWTFDQYRDYLRDEFERHGVETPGRSQAVERVLTKMSRSSNLSIIDEGRVLQYIMDTSGLGVRVTLLRQRLRELRSTGINGEDHNEIAQALLQNMETVSEVRRYGSNLWQYRGSHWVILPDEDVMARISQEYGQYNASKRHSDHKGILATIKNIAKPGIKTDFTSGVNFANGFLDGNLNLQPHDPAYGMIYTLPFRYMAERAGNSPLFFSFLDDCWGHDADYDQKLKALQEALCVTLFGMGPQYQRVILLKGVAKSGKSQLLKIAASLVPEDAKCYVPPNDWADKFLPTQMHEKLINICGELSEKKKIDGQRFKDIVDGSEMSGQHKGQQIFKFRPHCTHWFASNHTPKTDDTSEGFNRRWLILEFNKPVSPEKRRIDIGDLIVAEEREAIVAWAVQAMPRLQAQNEYTLPPSHVEVIREVAQENNSVRFFLETSQTVQVTPGRTSNHISEGRLYQEYWSFCFGPAAVRPVGSRAFRQRMKDLQSELGFQIEYQVNAMGVQDAHYRCITLAANKVA